MTERAEIEPMTYGTAPVPDYFSGTRIEWDALWAAQGAERRTSAAPEPRRAAERGLMSLSRPQRLALQAVNDGAVDYANPRTIRSLINRGLVVWIGDGCSREYKLTEAGEVAVSQTEAPQVTLAEFLLARITDREAVIAYAFENGIAFPILSPAEMLADCEAKRRIVEWAAPVLTNWPNAPEGTRYISEDGRDLLLILAAIYDLHPDYREEWKV